MPTSAPQRFENLFILPDHRIQYRPIPVIGIENSNVGIALNSGPANTATCKDCVVLVKQFFEYFGHKSQARSQLKYRRVHPFLFKRCRPIGDIPQAALNRKGINETESYRRESKRGSRIISIYYFWLRPSDIFPPCEWCAYNILLFCR